MEKQLNRLTGMTLSQRKEAIHWMAKQSEETRLSIMKCRSLILKKLGKNHDDSVDILDLAALCISCGENGFYADKKYRSGCLLTEGEMKDITHRKISIAREITKRRDIILGKLDKLWGDVVMLRQKGFGFRKIEKYLLMQHKVAVSKSTIHKYWIGWENDRKLPLD